jgi:hypothetical protein
MRSHNQMHKGLSGDPSARVSVAAEENQGFLDSFYVGWILQGINLLFRPPTEWL